VKIEDIVNSIRYRRIKITDHALEETENDELSFMDKLGKKENTEMKVFEKCPICGGELEEKTVEKVIRGGHHTAILTVKADVCLHCGERLYSEETVMEFENIRYKLKRQEVKEFQAIGQTFLAHPF